MEYHRGDGRGARHGKATGSEGRGADQTSSKPSVLETSFAPYAPESVSVAGAGLPGGDVPPCKLTPSIICKRTGAGRPFSMGKTVNGMQP